MCHTHTHTHTYTPTLTHTHSHKPTRKHTPTHTNTHRHIHYIPNYSPDPAHKCLYARPSLFRSLHEYIWPLFRALLPVQETSDLYPVLLVLVQHDAEEAQDHRGRRQGRQPLNNISYNIPISGFYMFLLNAFFSFRFQASMIPSSILCCFLLLLHPKSIPWYVLLGWQEIPIWWVKTLF